MDFAKRNPAQSIWTAVTVAPAIVAEVLLRVLG
jgi:hypothetical protein